MLAESIKRLTAALSVVAAGVLSVTPAQAEYRGGGVVHSFTNCEAYGWQFEHGWPVRGIYGPSEVFGDPSTVSLFNTGGGAWHFNVTEPFEIGRIRTRGRGTGIHRTQWNWEVRPILRIMERTVVSPRNGDFADAEIVDLRIRVQNFAGLRRCTADVELSLHRRN